MLTRKIVALDGFTLACALKAETNKVSRGLTLRAHCPCFKKVSFLNLLIVTFLAAFIMDCISLFLFFSFPLHYYCFERDLYPVYLLLYPE